MCKSILRNTLLVGALAIWGPGSTAHAEVETLAWADLVDQSAQVFEDPYADLPYEHLSAIMTVARLRATLAEAGAEAANTTDLRAQLQHSETELAEAGIDVDWYIAQRWVVAEKRRLAAWAGNTDIVGRPATLSGFVIPAPPDSDGTVSAYLVARPGMCSHMPPPPPNQLVRLKMPDGWSASMMHEPLTVSGTLSITPSERNITVVDGPVPMASAYEMQVSLVAPMKELKESRSRTRPRVQDILERRQQTD